MVPLLPQGALVANYPWDGTPQHNTEYQASPDDATFRHLAQLYATSHKKMSLPDNKVRALGRTLSGFWVDRSNHHATAGDGSRGGSD